MDIRVHTVAGNGEIVTQGVMDPEDEGAPPPLPPGGRIHAVSKDGDIAFASSSPQSEEEMIQRREEAAKKLAAAKSVGPIVSLPSQLSSDPTSREVRLRCLEIAARDSTAGPSQVMAAAREMLKFVEQG